LQPLGPGVDELFESARDDLRMLRGARLFLSGGTGFVGSWLLESVAWANHRLATDISVVVLTRNADAFARKAPHLAGNAGFSYVAGDVRERPAAVGAFDGVIHAATPASAELNRKQPFLMLDTILDGGRACLDLAAASGPIPFLFTSSGAVYGPQPDGVAALSEAYAGAPDCLSPANAYHEGKRIGELQCALAAQTLGLQAKIARLFAFVGPYLPLDRHFAIGNFIADGLAGRTIDVKGDGTTVRSYLYASDMVAWLWAIYVRGATLRAYNVGSARSVTIAQLARLVAASFDPPSSVTVRERPHPGGSPDRYVPDVARISRELGVSERFSLESAVARTIAYHRGYRDTANC